MCFGVAVTCPRRDFFDFRLGDKAPFVEERLRRDFPEVAQETFCFAAECVREELGGRAGRQPQQGDLQHLFTRAREGMVLYGKTRAVVADSPAALLEEAYARYVVKAPHGTERVGISGNGLR